MGRRQEPGGAPRMAKAKFCDLVLVCGKCAKRQGVERKRIGRALKRAFKAAAPEKGAGKVRVLETGCLGPCPKRMLTLATPHSLARRRVLLIDPDLDALGPEALGLGSVPAMQAPATSAPLTVAVAAEPLLGGAGDG